MENPGRFLAIDYKCYSVQNVVMIVEKDCSQLESASGSMQ